MYVNEERKVFFYLMYQALGESLEPVGFKAICESLVREGADFDAKLHKDGLIR